MATREEMIAASKKRYGKEWKPIDWHGTGDPEMAPRETYKYWNVSCYNPESGCSVHTKEVDQLTAQYDHEMGHDGGGGTLLARDGSHQEWMREKIDKAEATRRYAEARDVALAKWEAVAAPDQARTIALCRETNVGWHEHARYLDGVAAEIDAGMKSGRFKTSKGGGKRGGSCGGNGYIATDSSSLLMAAGVAGAFLLIAMFMKGG
jgi:hypothetical protein